MNKTITFNEEEAKALMELLHAACRYSGLQAANPAAVWQLKIQNAKPERKVTSIKKVKEKS